MYPPTDCNVVGNCVGARTKSLFLGLLVGTQMFFLCALVNLVLSSCFLYVPDMQQNETFIVALWVVGGLQSGVFLIFTIDMLFMFYGMGGYPGFLQCHRTVWCFIGRRAPILQTYTPMQPGVWGGGIKSELNWKALTNSNQTQGLELNVV